MNIIEIDSYINHAFQKYEDPMSKAVYQVFKEERDKLFVSQIPNFRQYMGIVRLYVPHEIYTFLDYEQKIEIQWGRLTRSENLTDNILIHFKNLITKYVYKYSWNLMSIENRLMIDFDQFRRAYLELNIDRKNFISHELVLYVILKRNNIKCKIDDFESLKKCHISICVKVLEHLNWDNYFLRYNKQTMDKLEQYINEFLDNIKSMVTEDCQFDIELIKVKLHEAINPNLIDGVDTCDQQVNRCTYVLKKGEKQGQECGKRCKSNFCAKHAKRMFKETEGNL